MTKYNINPHGKNGIKKSLLFSLGIILGIGVVVFTLEKTHVINLYSNDTSSSLTTNVEKPVNQIDYSPATPTDNEEINKQKESGQLGGTSTPTLPKQSNDSAIQITFVANSQDSQGKPLSLAAIISGATDGTCTYVLTMGNKTITKNSSIKSQGSYYSCEPIDIAYSELENGIWTIKLTVTTKEGRTNNATTTTTIG